MEWEEVKEIMCWSILISFETFATNMETSSKLFDVVPCVI